MDVVIERMNELSDTELRVILVIRYATTVLSVSDIQTQTGRGRQVYIAIKELLKRNVIEKTNHTIQDNVHKWTWEFLWDKTAKSAETPIAMRHSMLEELSVTEKSSATELPTTEESSVVVTDKPKSKLRTQKSTVAQPSAQQHAAVKAYVDVTHRRPKHFVADAIALAVGDDETVISAWKEVVKTWLLSGWNPQNVDGMLDMFKNRNNQTTKQNGTRRRVVIDPKPNKTVSELEQQLADYLKENEAYHEAN